MVRTVVIPQNTDIHFLIPLSYIGKEIEIIAFSKDDVKEEKKSPSQNFSSKFKGLLTEDEAVKYQEYLIKARNQWDRDI